MRKLVFPVDEFIHFIGLPTDGEYTDSNRVYTVDIANSNEWGRMFSKLNKNDELEQVEDGSLLTVHNASIIYLYDGEYGMYQIVLTADYDHNRYELVVNEV